MSSFSVHITTDNAAFEGGNLADEIARCLRSVAYNLDHDRVTLDRGDSRYGANLYTITDDNGNNVGRYFWTDRDATHDDSASVDAIHGLLDREEWHADTLDGIAEWITRTGRTIGDSAVAE